VKDFIDEIGYYGLSARIKRLSDALNSEARKIYTHLDFDIEPNWHLVFLSLKEQSLTVTELAKQLQFSHPAIVKIIQRMKERGYVKSKPDKKDSRKQLLSLTAKSKKLLPTYEKEWHYIQQIMDECTDDPFLEGIRLFEERMSEKPLLQRLRKLHAEEGNSTAHQHTILNCTKADIPAIMQLYEQAIALMKSRKQVHWRHFPQSMIEEEIKEKRLWKLTDGNNIICIWTTTFSDPIIWEEKNADPAVYLHKITTAPAFRGNNWAGVIVQWAKDYARKYQKQYVRLDTVGNNRSLIAHYEKNGFTFLGSKKLQTTEGLPAHYQEGDVCFFEIML
jgi:DNA-binding MarR family transcriptional regulator